MIGLNTCIEKYIYYNISIKHTYKDKRKRNRDGGEEKYNKPVGDMIRSLIVASPL